MKFIVDKKLFDNYENLSIGLVVCKNFDNKKDLVGFDSKMDEINDSIKTKFEGVELAEYPIIRKWRDIYKSFGEKKSRSSVEALIRRTVNGKELSRINPIVDIYNLVSLKYELPIGGEDLDTIKDDIKLTYAEGDEDFICLGETEIEHPNVGEIVYKSDKTVICRNFNYRESDITKLTDDTKNAVLVIENVLNDKDYLLKALNELADNVSESLNGDTKVVILDKENNEIEL